MAELLNFFMSHPMLSGLMCLIIVLLVANELRNRSPGVTRLAPNQVVDLVNHSKATVLDLREVETYRKGTISGSINLPFAELENKLKTLGKYKPKPLILVCARGEQSIKAGATLKEAGFEQLYQLSGGIEAWKTEQYPLT